MFLKRIVSGFSHPKPLFASVLLLVVLAAFRSEALGQDVALPRDLPAPRHSKHYWSYSVVRTGTVQDSVHSYRVFVSLVEQDKNGKFTRTMTIKDAQIVCQYGDSTHPGISRFEPKEKNWITSFTIQTNQVTPAHIIIDYNGKRYKMSLLMNTGMFPGEGEDKYKEEDE
jgi:hypothetical protein